MEELYLTGTGGYALSLAVYECENAAATVQIVHGMEEHKQRYDSFAEYLSQKGLNVVVSDLRGHGKNAPLLSHIADRKGAELLIRDQKDITAWIRQRFPQLPILLFSHSMGTIITRVLLKTDSSLYRGAVLAGYVHPYPGVTAGLALGKCIQCFRGAKGHSPLLYSLSAGAYAKAMKEKETDLDWLSYNRKNVADYLADPLCGKDFSVASYCAMYGLLRQMGSTRGTADLNVSLPILLVSGIDDPCTGGEEGRAASLALLAKTGFRNTSVITYDHMRHEILNEDGHKKVYEDLARFLNEAVRAK